MKAGFWWRHSEWFCLILSTAKSQKATLAISIFRGKTCTLCSSIADVRYAIQTCVLGAVLNFQWLGFPQTQMWLQCGRRERFSCRGMSRARSKRVSLMNRALEAAATAVLSGTTLRAVAVPPCAPSQVKRSAFAANLRHSSSLQRRPQAPQWQGGEREGESGRRRGREMVDTVMKDRDRGLWCFVFYYLQTCLLRLIIRCACSFLLKITNCRECRVISFMSAPQSYFWHSCLSKCTAMLAALWSCFVHQRFELNANTSMLTCSQC